FYQFAILEAGNGTVGQDGKAQAFSNYTLFFNVPGQIIYWDISPDWRGYYFNLSESFYTVPLEGFPRLAALPFFANFTPGIRLLKPEAEQLTGLFSQLVAARELPTTHFHAISKGLVNGILAYGLRYYARYVSEEAVAATDQSPAARFVALARKRVTALSLGLPAQPLTPGQLAEELFVSPQHLSAVVKEATGRTPTVYLQETLMQEAQKLLRATSLPISTIADQLAFTDPSYFSRVFKKVVGKSPAAYRQEGLAS
ncbi:MAG: AraC family transcriptional regulator, partial [Bacteroidota bacterium]